MRLLMWHKGGKHIHAHGKGSAKNTIDMTADRLIFYDAGGSIVYDQSGTWYKDGRPHTPTYPLSFALEDGRTVTADNKGGQIIWRVQ